ncbi:hypothetical protein AX13_05065 [Comamonas aquatica DA1877]|uniref:Uncharacterized protein n=1 Tax=Comamonas aquatica DA1877 TaxID=1457173 RepID=A0A014NJ71_9BURK|nr:hypothetical protein AX13_05065 [Comamonas aquatica DA1877]
MKKRLLKQRDLVSTGMLRLVKGMVGILDQAFSGLPFTFQASHTN